MIKIVDPLYDRITIKDEIIEKLIDTKEMQRLRQIMQLGGTSLAFPGATHTRFSHSLGVMHLADRFAGALELKENDRLTLICAALLHDLGHGPLSHAFESISKTHHEFLSARIILENTDVNKVLENHKKGFSKEVASVLNDTHKNKVLSQIITSQVDVDRLDYLARDSFYTGTVYGKTDIEWLISNIRIVDEKLVFKVKCMPALENYFVGRFHMFKMIYHHKSAMRYESLIKMIFDEIRENNLAYGIWKSVIEGREIPLNDYLLMDDYSLLTFIKSFSTSHNEKLRILVDKLLRRDLPESRQFETEAEAKKFNPNGVIAKQTNELYKDNHEDMKDASSVYIKMSDRSIVKMESHSSLIKSIIKPTKKVKWVNTFYE